MLSCDKMLTCDKNKFKYENSQIVQIHTYNTYIHRHADKHSNILDGKM